MTELRVLHVVLSLNPGGTERLVIEIARRLQPDIPMAVCCLDEPGAWSGKLLSQGIEVTALGRPSGFHPSLGRAIAAAARAHDAAVIHAHHYSPFVYSCLARFSQPSLHVVFTEHGRLSDAGPSRKRRLANGVLARLPHAVAAVSRDLRDHLVAEGFPEHRVAVVYNGIDVGPLPDDASRLRVRSTLGADGDDFVVGTIARLDPVKNLGTLLIAARDMSRQTRCLVVIVGDGPERPALERAVHDFGMADRVRFLGQRDDARQWLAGCDAYVNSSVSEGISLTILEAMAAGLPVVATRVGGTPEILDESCGRLVPARDAGAITASLEAVAGDRRLRAAIGAAARRRVEERFTLDRMVETYRNVYVDAASA